jgi:hypothetical protein
VVVDLLPRERPEQRDELGAQRRPANHELEVVASAVMVRPVEAREGNPIVQPSQKPLVPDVHFKRDLRLFAVPADVALGDQKPEDQTFFEIGSKLLQLVTSADLVSPVGFP